MPTEPIVVRAIGTAQINVGRTQIRPNALRRFGALLYLSAEASRRVPRRVLIDLLFPDQTERNGLHSLRELVYQLKSAGVALDATQEGVELPMAAVRADYADMLGSERLTLEQIRAAQGGFLPGYTPHDSEAYKEWFEPFRAKTTLALSRVLLRDQARARDVANLEHAEAAARACLAVSPLNEHAVRALAETMALGGAKADAVNLLANYAAEVGSWSPELQISAQLVKQRLMERLADYYRPPTELPFAGRDTEMLELRRRLAASVRGMPQCVLIVGEPGIGKSRLISEFGTLARLEGSYLARLTAEPIDRSRPMSLFVDLVPILMRIPGAIGIAPASMEALARLTKRGPHGADLDDAEPDAISRAITHAIEDLISAVTGETHLTIAVDDAHWTDALSLRVLAHLAQTRNRRLLIVLTSRERDHRDLAAPNDELIVLPLQPLQPDVSYEIARRALMGTEGQSHSALQSWMADVSNGLPLFLASLVAHFATTREPFVVPPSLHDLIRRRLDQLMPGPTLVLQTCVLLGSLASLPRIVSCLDIPYGEIVLAIADLEQAHTVKLVEGRLIPAHALISEALLDRTSKAVQSLLHLRVAAILEAELSSFESPTVLWSCAEHWIAAGDHERAFRLLKKCAEHARDIGRPRPAAEILVRCATMEIDSSARSEALREAVRLAKAAHEHDLVLRIVAQFRELDSGRYDDIEIAEFHAISVTHRGSPDYEERVLAYLESDEAPTEFRIRAALAALQYADNNDRANLAHRVARAVSESDLKNVDQILALQYCLVYETAFGDSLKAGTIARDLQAVAAQMPGPAGTGLQFNAMVALLRIGEIDEAFAACNQVYVRSKECASVKLQQLSALQLAVILVDKGRFAESLEWRNVSQSLNADNKHLIDGFDGYMHEIDFSLVEGNVARARTILQQCEDLQIFNSPIRERWRRGLRARIKQLSNEESLTDEELQELIWEGNDRIPSTGIRELEVAVICVELCERGDHFGAQEALTKFLSSRHRLRHLPLTPHLKQVVAVCGLHIVPASPIPFASA